MSRGHAGAGDGDFAEDLVDDAAGGGVSHAGFGAHDQAVGEGGGGEGFDVVGDDVVTRLEHGAGLAPR